MALIDHVKKQVSLKIVYYGPGLCGKTTNLQWLHDHAEIRDKGELLSLATDADRTLFFDLLPIGLGTIRGMATRLQLYTVPGQVYYESTRKMVLKGADGVIFVADSQEGLIEANLESYRGLLRNVEANEMDPDTPIVFQYNKRDLPGIMKVADMEAKLNPGGAPSFEAIAVQGVGVQETLKAVARQVVKRLFGEGAAQQTQPPKNAVDTEPDPAPSRDTRFSEGERRAHSSGRATLLPGRGLDRTPLPRRPPPPEPRPAREQAAAPPEGRSRPAEKAPSSAGPPPPAAKPAMPPAVPSPAPASSPQAASARQPAPAGPPAPPASRPGAARPPKPAGEAPPAQPSSEARPPRPSGEAPRAQPKSEAPASEARQAGPRDEPVSARSAEAPRRPPAPERPPVPSAKAPVPGPGQTASPAKASADATPRPRAAPVQPPRTPSPPPAGPGAKPEARPGAAAQPPKARGPQPPERPPAPPATRAAQRRPAPSAPAPPAQPPVDRAAPAAAAGDAPTAPSSPAQPPAEGATAAEADRRAPRFGPRPESSTGRLRGHIEELERRLKQAEQKAPDGPALPTPDPGRAGDGWLYLREGVQRGPIDFDDLVDLILTHFPEDTPVWRRGMEQYTPANRVAEIVDEIPPPLPERPSSDEQGFPDFDAVPEMLRSVLIADEDGNFRRYLGMPLAAQGFTIHEAADGNAAWSLAQEQRPWLILADVSLPLLDGFEFCRRVRASSLTRHTPLIFVSGSDDYKERYRGLQLGADDFLSKRTPLRELLLRVQLALTRYSEVKAETPREAGMSGEVEILSAPGVLQICHQGRISGRLTARRPDGGSEVEIRFREGDIVGASAAEKRDVEAVYAFLAWTRGHFDFVPGDPGEGAPIAQSVEHLLLEGCRLLDEENRDAPGGEQW